MVQNMNILHPNNQAYFFDQHERRFGNYHLADEECHEQPLNAPYALTETQFFGFNIPEEAINGFLYLWHHPALGMTSGGVMVTQGIKPIALASEIFDYADFLPNVLDSGKLSSFQLPNSYAVEMLEPGRRFRTTYHDEARDSGFDIVHEAVCDPLVWPASKHFEQLMRTKGDLTLRGRRYEVNGYGIRDRSWSEARNEDSPASAPPCWMTGVFDDSCAFHLTATDDPELDPIWKPYFQPARDSLCNFGWIIIDGVPRLITGARKITRYDAALMPTQIEMSFTDDRGDNYNLNGRIIAAAPLNTWPNIRVATCLVRWDWNGRIGYGDAQEAQWNDFISACL